MDKLLVRVYLTMQNRLIRTGQQTNRELHSIRIKCHAVCTLTTDCRPKRPLSFYLPVCDNKVHLSDHFIVVIIIFVCQWKKLPAQSRI